MAFRSRAAEKLREQGLAAGRIVVLAHTNHFRPEEAQYHGMLPVRLPIATADTGKLIAAARPGLGALYCPGHRYKKAGILLLELTPAAAMQGNLFAAADTPRSKARMRASTCRTGASAVAR